MGKNVFEFASYSNFSISPWYDFRASQYHWGYNSTASQYDTLASQSPQSIIPRRVNKKSAKTDSPGCHTPASESPQGMRPQEVSFLFT